MSSGSTRKLRMLVVAAHPVQYMAPLFRRMAKHPRLDLQVAYCSLNGAEGAYDPEFGRKVKWDVPLLDGYSWTQVPNIGSGGEGFWGLNNPGLREIIRDGRFDAVLCLTGYVRASFWIARKAAKKARAAFLFGADTTTIESRDRRVWKKWIKKLTWPFLFRLADQVVVPSSASLDLMTSLGIPEERITLTPYSVDNDWWMEQSAKADREEERKKLGLGENERVVLFCAKLQPWKCPMDLLHAAANLKIRDVKLVFAGEGPQRGELEAEAARLGFTDRTKFLGFTNQSMLPALYKSVDMMVLPSAYEPFAVVVNEAMCCGCPVMVSDRVGAARDLVLPIAPDFIFPARDVEALAEKLSAALGDPERMAKARQAAIAHIKTWSPDRNVEATITAVEAGVKRVRGL